MGSLSPGYLISDEDLVAARVAVLVDDVDPDAEFVERLPVGDVIHEQHAISTCGVTHTWYRVGIIWGRGRCAASGSGLEARTALVGVRPSWSQTPI